MVVGIRLGVGTSDSLPLGGLRIETISAIIENTASSRDNVSSIKLNHSALSVQRFVSRRNKFLLLSGGNPIDAIKTVARKSLQLKPCTESA